jgi:chlorobactene glucosyltransferase
MRARTRGVVLGAALTALAAAETAFGRRSRRNFIGFPSVEPTEEAPPNLPLVSVVVPARNEARNIVCIIESLLAQNYQPREVIVVDDASTDSTGDIARRDPVTVVDCDGPPPGWTGKNYACHAGQQSASGEWLLFTDADTYHLPDALTSVIAYALRNELDAISVAPFIECGSFWERLLLPSVHLQFMVGMPSQRINDPTDPAGAAFGHYILIRRREYDRIGGHCAVKTSITEDQDLGLLMKEMKVNYHFTTGYRILRSRMYRGLAEIVNGFSKNVPQFVVKAKVDGLAAILSVCVYGLYLPLALLAIARPRRPTALAALAAYAAGVRQTHFHLKTLKVGAPYGLLNPVGSAVNCVILSRAVYKGLVVGQVEWKGRTYGSEQSRVEQIAASDQVSPDRIVRGPTRTVAASR